MQGVSGRSIPGDTENSQGVDPPRKSVSLNDFTRLALSTILRPLFFRTWMGGFIRCRGLSRYRVVLSAQNKPAKNCTSLPDDRSFYRRRRFMELGIRFTGFGISLLFPRFFSPTVFLLPRQFSQMTRPLFVERDAGFCYE